MVAADSALWCVVPAAGRGARFGAEVPKQYVSVAGKPLLRWTLERLAAHPRVAGIVVVLSAGDRWWSADEHIGGKPLLTATGGDERADSVLAGLVALETRVADDAFVLVHDAARPCVRDADITRLVELGSGAGGALLAAPLRDTLKRADADGRVAATEPRESRWRALTPQLFRRGELAAALARARADGAVVTDEAMAMERVGYRPLLVEGSDDNIKVTTPADLARVRALLAGN
ncbi:MAG: 2-C-methyl-D-erythritol 4-phosphate cytidylyltransferase [Dokdonella sp.]|nr:2-C-methyl-D-erythritol 4-phosphate cytidylyltransferase [Dokdonella sp.]MCW5568237.1 2-C-methyl-D-erythritol 4-phosphate cytidylyltransferase [Dokdonella sp.]